MGPTLQLIGLVMILAALQVQGRSLPQQKSKRNLYPPVAPTLDNMPGIPGKDYPTFSQLPATRFHCSYPGYYADVDANCQVFHVCQVDGRHDRFMCPNGTLFNQEFFICDWWYNVECSAAPTMFYMNQIFHPYPEADDERYANINAPSSRLHHQQEQPSHLLEAVKPSQSPSDRTPHYERNDYEIRYSGARITPPPSEQPANLANFQDEPRFLDNRGHLTVDDTPRPHEKEPTPDPFNAKETASNFATTTPAYQINYSETYEASIGADWNQVAADPTTAAVPTEAAAKHEAAREDFGDLIKPDVIEKVALETDGKFIETIGPSQSDATLAVGHEKVSPQEVTVDVKTYKEEEAPLKVPLTEQTEQAKHATYESDSHDPKSIAHSAEPAQILHQATQPARKQRLRKVVIKRPLTKTKNPADIEATWTTSAAPTTPAAATPPPPNNQLELESEAEVIEGRSLTSRPEKVIVTTDLIPSTTITITESSDTLTTLVPEILQDAVKDAIPSTTTEVSTTSEPDAELVGSAVLNTPISVTLAEETSGSATESVPDRIPQDVTEAGVSEALQVQGRTNSATESAPANVTEEIAEAGLAATLQTLDEGKVLLLSTTNQALLEESTQAASDAFEPSSLITSRLLSETTSVSTDATTISAEEKLLEVTTDTADVNSMSRTESFATEATLEVETVGTNAVSKDVENPQITTEAFGSNHVFVAGFGMNSQQEPVPDKQLIREQEDSSREELEAAFIGPVRNLEGRNSLRAGFIANSRPVAADVVRTAIELERDSKSFKLSGKENSRGNSIDTSLNEDPQESSTLPLPPPPLQLASTETVVESTLSSVDPWLTNSNLANQVGQVERVPSEESAAMQTVTDSSTDPALSDDPRLDEAPNAKLLTVEFQSSPPVDSTTEIPDSSITELPEDNSVTAAESSSAATIPSAPELRQKTSASLEELQTSGASKRNPDEEAEKEIESTANNRLAKSITVPVAVFFKLPLSASSMSQLIRK